jgi:hypothetical protein
LLNSETLDDILEAQGALPFASAVSGKDHVTRLLVQHILLDYVQYLIDELKEGLQTLGALQN